MSGNLSNSKYYWRCTALAAAEVCRQLGRRVRLPMVIASGMMAAFQFASAQPNPNSPTAQWVPILYGNGNYPDPSADQQTGSAESDIVGNVGEPSLYMQYNSGYLGFRLRVGADVSPAGFKGDAFIGLDANGGTALNLFIGVDNSGSPNQLGIWDPGTGLNTSPNTTSIVSTPLFTYTETSTDYGFTSVNATINPGATNFDLNADGKTDQFLTFYVPFTNVVSALAARGITGFTTNSPMELVAATATQPNSLNEDLNGVSGGINSSLTWSQLGGISELYSPAGVAPIPEPSVKTLYSFAGGVTLFHFIRRRRLS